MRKWIGILCIFLGVICILASVGFIVYNRWEDKSAQAIANSLLEDVQSQMDEKAARTDDAEKLSAEMASITVEDDDCIWNYQS